MENLKQTNDYYTFREMMHLLCIDLRFKTWVTRHQLHTDENLHVSKRKTGYKRSPQRRSRVLRMHAPATAAARARRSGRTEQNDCELDSTQDCSAASHWRAAEYFGVCSACDLSTESLLALDSMSPAYLKAENLLC